VELLFQSPFRSWNPIARWEFYKNQSYIRSEMRKLIQEHRAEMEEGGGKKLLY
jgi:hypothetical protein